MNGSVVREQSGAVEFVEQIYSRLVANDACNARALRVVMKLRERQMAGEQVGGRYATVAPAPGEPPVGGAVLLPPGDLVLAEVPLDAVGPLSRHLIEAGWRVCTVSGASEVASSFAAVWGRRSGREAEPGMPMLILRLQALRWTPEVSGRLRRATQSDEPLLLDWYRAFVRETGVPGAPDGSAVIPRMIDAGQLFVWDDGRPVSMAGWSRPIATTVNISLVYTPAADRGAGRASACVAALSQHLLDEGHGMCCLYTDRDNATSNGLYMRLGYEVVGSWQEFRFTPRPCPPGTATASA